MFDRILNTYLKDLPSSCADCKNRKELITLGVIFAVDKNFSGNTRTKKNTESHQNINGSY